MSIYATDCYSSGTGVSGFYITGSGINTYIAYIKSQSVYFGNYLPTTITFDTIYDINNNFDGTTYTTPVTGFYNYNTNSFATGIQLNYRLNGIDTIIQNVNQNGFGIISLTIGDTLSFNIKNFTSSYQTYSADSIRITLYKI